MHINIYPQLILPSFYATNTLCIATCSPLPLPKQRYKKIKWYSMLDGGLNIWWSSPLDMPCHFISPFFFLTHRLLHTSESTTLPRHGIQIVITTHFFFHFGLQSFVYVTMVGFLSNMMTRKPRDSLLFEKTLDFECMMVSLMKCLQTFETIW